MMFTKIKDIQFGYVHGQNILDGFSMEMEQGEIVAILGKSGSGKSTLLRVLSGLEKPHQGSIEVDDQMLVTNHMFIQPHLRKIGMVFQDYALFPHLNVVQNVAYGLFKKPYKERKNIAQHFIDLVDLTDKMNQYPYQLSGGQQQRVALARALAPKPNMLLLDEPFSNLDVDLKKQIRQEIKHLLHLNQTSCIFVTHDIEDARDIATRIIYLDKGRNIRQEIIKK